MWFVLCILGLASLSQGVDGALAEQMAETTQVCCSQGTKYARGHSSEDCSSSVPPDVPPAFGTLCLFAMDQCCKEYFQKKRDCDAAVEIGVSSNTCNVAAASSKDCCQECVRGKSVGASQGIAACTVATNEGSAESMLAGEAFTQCCKTAANEALKAGSQDPSRDTPEHGVKPVLLSRQPATGDSVASLCEEYAPNELCAHHCIPVPGSYKCECNPGYQLMPDGRNCKEVIKNRCKPRNPCHHKCNDNGVEVKCSCRRGYQLMADGKSCEDIDECRQEPEVCLPSTECYNVQGSYKCLPKKNYSPKEKGQCPAGFTRNSVNNVCDDVNECALPSPPCPSYLCENTVGGYKCGGVSGDPANLPNRVRPPMDDRCPPGFRMGYEECEDVDECVVHKDDCNPLSQYCINTRGSFYCQNKVSKHCRPGFKIDPITNKCEDINECDDGQDICRPDQICVNVPGEYDCKSREEYSRKLASKCPEGMRKRPGSTVCEDIDECLEGTHLCDAHQNCLNTNGSHECRCKLGFEIDHITGGCVDLNECATATHNCIMGSQRCDNTIGSFICVRFTSCGTGYILQASTSQCEDVDECALGTHNCMFAGPEWRCVNQPGSFSCVRNRPSTTSTTAPPEYEYEYYDSDEIEDNATKPAENKPEVKPEQAAITTTTPVPTYSVPNVDERPAQPEVDPSSTSNRDIQPPETTSLNNRNSEKPTESDKPNYQQPEPKQPNSREPESRQPDYQQPEKRQPDSQQPESQPEPPQPDYQQPESRQPDNQQPESRQPVYQQPESRQPDYQQPESRPDYQQPETRPDYQQPQPPQPDYQQPESRQQNNQQPEPRPDYQQPESRPDYQQPESRQPDYQQPESQQPEYQQPESRQPDYQQPNYQQPESQQPEYQQPDYQQPEQPETSHTEQDRPKSRLSDYKPDKPLKHTPNYYETDSQPSPTPPQVVLVDAEKETATVEGEKKDDGSVVVDTRDLPKNQWTKVNEKPSDCRAGFELDSNGACVDIDECATNRHSCSGLTENCRNTMGGYLCDCAPGFRRDLATGDCNIVTTSSTTSTTTERSYFWGYPDYRPVTNRPFRPRIRCDVGYHLNSKNGKCEDVDECTNGQAKCAAVELCVNTDGGYRCECPPNWKLDDVRHRCVPLRSSTGIPPGYENEPEYPPPNQQELDQTFQGSKVVEPEVVSLGDRRSTFTCPNGYRLGFDNTCEDIDECTTGEARCDGMLCTNLAGGYVCSCPRGHRLAAGGTCQDVDECSMGGNVPICSQHADCVNTIGSYQCKCHSGFRSAPVNDKVCVDVDECTESPAGSLCQHRCNNVWGSYRCTCHRGYRLNPDNSTCSDVDECTEFKSKILCVGRCVNEPGSYRCTCPLGYRLSEDKRSCIDIDECETGEAPCANSGQYGGSSDVCLNTRGGYRCHRIVCPAGYKLENKHRCTRIEKYCAPADWDCAHQPTTYSYNFITFVSKLYIPSSQVDLFTMRGPSWANANMRFQLRLVNIDAPPTVKDRADINAFLLVHTGNQAVMSLVRSLEGPQSIELELSMDLYNGDQFGGTAVARLYIYVSEFEF